MAKTKTSRKPNPQGLTKKQSGFVDDYIETGIGETAAMLNYDAKNGNVARNIASTNLIKPNIIKAIADRLPDDLLEKRHLELLNKRETISYKKKDDTLEVIDMGPDVQGVSRGLDMAYKIKGSYAAEKTQNTNVNINVNTDPEQMNKQKAIRDKYEKELLDSLQK